MESFLIFVLGCILSLLLGARLGSQKGYKRGLLVGRDKSRQKAERFKSMTLEQQQQYLQMKIDAKAQRMMWRLEDEAKERKTSELFYQKGLNRE